MKETVKNSILDSEVQHPAAITATVLDSDNGSRKIEGVIAVRIHSSDYVLLIMKDYAPALGKVEGDVCFVTEDGDVCYNSVRGFYKHQRNAFVLLISSMGNE